MQRALEPLARVAASGVPVFLVPGNHERSAIPYPLLAAREGLHVFERPSTFLVERRGLRVAFAGFPYARDVRRLFPALLAATGYRASDADARVLCIHHCVEGAVCGPPPGHTFRDGDDVIAARDRRFPLNVLLAAQVAFCFVVLLVASLFVSSVLLSVVSWYTTQQGMALYLSPWFSLLASLGVQSALVLVAWLVGVTESRRGLLVAKLEQLAAEMTREEGKTLPEAKGEVRRAINIFRYFAGEGSRLPGYLVPSERDRVHMFAVRKPVGVAGLITPWNFPSAIPAWKLAPALICGNTAVIKPASAAPLSAWRIVEAPPGPSASRVRRSFHPVAVAQVQRCPLARRVSRTTAA